MSNYANEAGEPYMTAAQLNFEAALDEQSAYERQFDDFYSDYDDESPCYDDQDLCTGGDLDYVDEHTGACSWCEKIWPFDWS